jgi:hypothetical protein
MTTGGIIFMVISWIFIFSLAGFCIYKMFQPGNEGKVGPRDVGM